MKIAHVVSYVSKDGAFGGPVAVALAQSAELVRLGDQVDLIAGWDGSQELNVEGVVPRLFPVTKLFGNRLTGLMSLQLLWHFWRNRASYDFVHIHLGRDLITSLAAQVAIWSGIPFLAQTHGMVMPDTRRSVRIFDFLLMRRILSSSVRVLTLSAAESCGISTVSRGRSRTQLTTNGLEFQGRIARVQEGRTPKVIFLARLHPRKRVLTFAEAAVVLRRSGVNAQFEIYGPDEGELPSLREFIDKSKCSGLRYMGAISPGAGPSLLRDAAIYVLPSVGEVVPMSVLESMSVGTPVVITNDCAMAPKLAECGAAVVTDGTVGQLAIAVRSLLDSEELRSNVAENASRLMQNFYNISLITAAIRDVYESKHRRRREPKLF